MKLSILLYNTNDGTFTLLMSWKKFTLHYFQAKMIIHKLFIDELKKKDQAHPEWLAEFLWSPQVQL